MAQKLSVTLLDMGSQILPGVLDSEMAGYAAKHLRQMGMKILTGTALASIQGEQQVTAVKTAAAGELPADVVVLAIGVRPATEFLKESGIELEKGAVVVDEYQQTNLPDIYAAGDCAVVKNRVTGNRQWSAMGSTANLTGRCLARTLTGTDTPYPGCLGTGVVRLASDLNVGRTGLSETQAKEAGFDPVSVVCITDDKAHYYPDASIFVTKLLADRATGRLLGLQVIGAGAVDKMTDVAVVGISTGLSVSDYDTMDLAYAPPFSTAIHPFVQACYVLENKINGTFAGGSKDLCTHILREEWGFDGVVVTDWGDMDIVVDGADAVAAGNDVIMPGGPPVIAQVLAGYKDGDCTLEELQKAVEHLLTFVLVQR